MRDALIVAILVLVAVAGAVLSFVAWHRMARPSPEDQGEPQLDSDGPDV